MAEIDARSFAREDAQVFAGIEVENRQAQYRIRVRNLSPAGLMAAGDVSVLRGSRVTIAFPGIEPVAGIVAWVQEDRFGVGFEDEVDCDRIKVAYELLHSDDRMSARLA